mmetsp:Transcript_86229/g.152661  ORF Transcript_86229/g.152661 Transcript_86229/m.152661 type:complete len:168 (+) Transcript_86229:17-520(+)
MVTFAKVPTWGGAALPHPKTLELSHAQRDNYAETYYLPGIDAMQNPHRQTIKRRAPKVQLERERLKQTVELPPVSRAKAVVSGRTNMDEEWVHDLTPPFFAFRRRPPHFRESEPVRMDKSSLPLLSKLAIETGRPWTLPRHAAEIMDQHDQSNRLAKGHLVIARPRW